MFLIDNIISFYVTLKIKSKIHDTNKDNTEYVRKEVLKWISKKSVLYNRIKNSYPSNSNRIIPLATTGAVKF